MVQDIRFGTDGLNLVVSWSEDSAPAITCLGPGQGTPNLLHGVPLLEVSAVNTGHVPASDRLVRTSIGAAARFSAHRESAFEGGNKLEIDVEDALHSVAATVELVQYAGVASVTSRVSLRNLGTEPLGVRSIASLTLGLGALGRPDVRAWNLTSGDSDWLAENRWKRTQLADLFPRLRHELTGHEPRGQYDAVSTGTWSTGKHLPYGFLSTDGTALAFQVEHNGAWRWEIGDGTTTGHLALGGPDDNDHQALQMLQPGESFETVPVSVAVGTDEASALASMTQHRRAARASHPDNASPAVVFNDYMNTVDGDPSTAVLLPLIEAAATAGAEVFCIDAGWYADTEDWWDSVGEWTASTTRFPGGLREVIGAIGTAGMVPGLWLEPEVVGVNSPAAAQLPDEAFFLRHGQRVVEHDRYHLDLRHPAAVSHLDSTVDRLVEDFGIGYFKLDYNIDPGAGTDSGDATVGAQLLEHNRAHLAWLESVLSRHPDLVLENCGSGAMRADFAMLSRLQLQSTSDQQDALLYPPIAAAAPLSVLPEQAANWAYPQQEMSLEEVAFTLTTGLSSRFYLSGFLDRLDRARMSLVQQAVEIAKDQREALTRSVPTLPLGLPGWDDAWTALALHSPARTRITVWNRDPDEHTTVLSLPWLKGQTVQVSTAFPHSLAAWSTTWDPETGELTVDNPTGQVSARLLDITVTDEQPTTVWQAVLHG